MLKFFSLLGIFFSMTAFGIIDNSWVLANNDLSSFLQDSYNPQIAINEQTNRAICVWYSYIGSNYYIIQSSYSTDRGQTWSTLTNISDAGLSVGIPQITINEQTNRAICVWARFNGSNNIIQSSYSTDGGQTWSTPIGISSVGNNSDQPQIVINEQTNRAICIWSNTSNDIIQSSYSTDGGQTWSTPIGISSVGNISNHPQIVINEQTNRAICVWLNTSNDIIQSSYSMDGGQSWSIPTNISDAGLAVYPAQITINEQTNRAICVWARFNGSNNIIQSSYSTDGGQTWSTPIGISSIGNNADQPQIAIKEQTNRTICVWRHNNGSNYIIQSSYSMDGGQSWSAAIDISETGENSQSPQIAIDTQTNITLCVWVRTYGSNNNIQSSYSTNGGKSWSPAIDITSRIQKADSPQIAIGNRIPICVWSILAESNYIIQAAYFIEEGLIKGFLTDKNNNFFFQRELVKELTWTPVYFAKYYNIYKNIEIWQVLRIKQDGKSPLVTLPSSVSNYVLHRVKKGEVYYITWENAEGDESRPIVIN